MTQFLTAKAGYTLIETIIVIVIVGIIASLGAVIMMQGISPYTSIMARNDMHYQARLAVERIAREARTIRSCADITAPTNPSGTLQFTDTSGTVVTFSVAGETLLRGGDVLATGITSATPFRFLDGAGNPTTACPGIRFVEIAVTAARGTDSLQIRTRVHPRSF